LVWTTAFDPVCRLKNGIWVGRVVPSWAFLSVYFID
jgi:hypothetical protein